MSNAHTYSKNNYVQVLLPIATQGDVNTSYVAPFSDGTGVIEAVFELEVGAITASIDMALYQATDSSGTGRKAITGAALTTVTSATDESVNTIQLSAENLDDVNGFKYIRAEVTVAGAATELYSVKLIGYRLRRPGSFTQHTSYRQAIEV